MWKNIILFLVVCFGATSIRAFIELDDKSLPGIELSYEPFVTWSGIVNRSEPFLVAYPRDGEDVAEVANWAYTHGRNVRIRGQKHAFSPLTVTEDDSPSKVILVDMYPHMRSLRIGSLRWKGKQYKTVVAGAGATMDEFFVFAEKNGVGITAAPEVGDISVGGVMAIGGHGTGVPGSKRESLRPGFTFGTVSNMITAFKAIVWDDVLGKYRVKSFSRDHADSGAFLIHAGRAVLTEITVMTGDAYDLSCVSLDIPTTELFAPKNAKGLRTFSALMEEYGRVDALQYSFTEGTWLKIWFREKNKRPESKEIREPYPFPFYGEKGPPGRIVLGPEFHSDAWKAMRWMNTTDLWGPAKNTKLHMKSPPGHGLIFAGFTIVTRRDHVQKATQFISEEYARLSEEYKRRGQTPIEGGMQIRATGLDASEEVLVPGAVEPLLSHARGVKGRPELDTVLWINTFTTAGDPKTAEFMRRFEEFAFERWNGGEDGVARPEWAKLWGYNDERAHGNGEFIRETIPNSFGVAEWNKAMEILNRYDPHQVFTNTFLRELMVEYREEDHHHDGLGWGRH